jgi:SAM-dependent methyltransferase
MAQIHGDNRNWAEDIFIENYLKGKKVETILSICCGFGHVERYFIQTISTVKSCLAIDLSGGAIAKAREIAAEEGVGEILSYETADLNTYDWKATEHYDLVIANGALHHILNLERALSGIKRSLKPDGWLYAVECIGPSYRDHPPRQLEIINSFIYLLPPELRRGMSTPFRHKHRFLRNAWIGLKLLRGKVNIPRVDNPSWSSLEKLGAKIGRYLYSRRDASRNFDFGIVHDSQKSELPRKDPSEGVRSAEIISLMKSTFSKVHVHPIGGAFMAYALDGAFFENYDPENRFHVELFERLCSLEEFFLNQGEVNPEYALICAQP